MITTHKISKAVKLLLLDIIKYIEFFIWSETLSPY